VDLRSAAAEVMTLAQHADADAALALARRTLADAEAFPDDGREVREGLAALCYATAVAEHVRGDHPAQIAACNHCLTHARSADSAGWVSNALSLRAMGHAKRGEVEQALLDLARSEVALERCTDPGLRNWGHTGLGCVYTELRLYELAIPQFEAAAALSAGAPTDPVPLAESRAIDLLNLAETELKWADELERATPYDGSGRDAERHRAAGHTHALAALAEAERVGLATMVATLRATALVSRPRSEAAASVEELRAELADPAHLDHHGGRAVIGAALARALWRSGHREEALQEAAHAARLSDAAQDWQVAASARWLQVEMQCEAGLADAVAGRDYAGMLSQVLWQQRLSTLQGAHAALEVERLRDANAEAARAALEDPLTGVGNRRAFNDALASAALESDVPTSVLVIDLDRFKAVNDTHGHAVGDAVLRAVADGLTSVARASDVVARLGGDEFVLVARGADELSGRRLAERASEALNRLRVDTPSGPVQIAASVGLATTGAGLDTQGVFEAADAAMYVTKERQRVG